MNNREIKFKFYERGTGQLIALGDIMQFYNPLSMGAVDVSQFTGLHDKNGVEIYEGDVIEGLLWNKPYSDNKKSCRVRYIVKHSVQEADDNEHNNKILAEDPSAFNTNPCFYGKKIWNEKGYKHGSWSEFAGCEVIGNVYQNPELLQ